MVKTLLFTFLIFLNVSFCCYSQKVETNWKELIGEEVLFLPISNPKLDIKFDCFFTDSLCTKPLNQSNFQIRNNIENNVFKVLNHFKVLNFGSGPSTRTYITKFESAKTGIIFLKVDYSNPKDLPSLSYYLTNTAHNRIITSPTIPIKVIEDYKKKIGETFIAKTSLVQEDFKITFAPDSNHYLREIVDLKSGKVSKITKFDIFKCLDLQFLSTHSIFKQPYLILQNQFGEQFKVAFIDYVGDSPMFQRRLSLSDFYTSKQYDAILEVNKNIEEHKRNREKEALLRREECIKLFGKTIGPDIAEGRIKIGMTKEMCIYAWGKPTDINRTITRNTVREQWVYDLGTYLYFENDKLVTIQD